MNEYSYQTGDRPQIVRPHQDHRHHHRCLENSNYCDDSVALSVFELLDFVVSEVTQEVERLLDLTATCSNIYLLCVKLIIPLFLIDLLCCETHF
jgi:hypothetical protein